jgi:hypothetical protein
VSGAQAATAAAQRSGIKSLSNEDWRMGMQVLIGDDVTVATL